MARTGGDWFRPMKNVVNNQGRMPMKEDGSEVNVTR